LIRDLPLTSGQISTHAAIQPAIAQHRTRAHLARVVLAALLLLTLALTLRWAMLDSDLTHDEDQWMSRSASFARAVRQGVYRQTFQSGHPGVLTMELAILGQGPGGAERFWQGAGVSDLVSSIPGYFDGLIEARRAFVLVTTLGILAISSLVWRLLGAGPALLGGLLLAVDPFFVGHSRVVQMDSLLSGLLLLSVLCGLVRWTDGGSRGWVLAGGVASGLAFLTKVPAVYLAVFVPLLALLVARRRGLGLVVDLVLWGLAGLATMLALWPALWINWQQVLTELVKFAGEAGGNPHSQGNFFFGKPVPDPGPLFYPLAAAFRLTPAAMLGLVALVLLSRWAPSSVNRPRGSVLLALAAYALGFTLLMTVGQKKFDRYLLPVFPALNLLAGAGLWTAICLLRQIVPAPTRRIALPLAGLGLAALIAWPALSVFPHYLTYYNPLLGGGPVAARTIPVGYGEGLVDAARWLNQQPNAAQLTVVTDSHDVLQGAFVGRAIALSNRVPSTADYLVLYHYQTQLRHWPRVLNTYSRRQPDHVVRLNGIDYARVYRLQPAPGRS
jgi:4-amino-4-deoxy-L-arabinose transferase-like glycosyltransferase